jgi:nitrite reductase/ring-hydroxylating ferredoxin subunit
MSPATNDVFIICSADSIRPGSAKSFSLSRIRDTGESRPFRVVVVRTDAGAFVGYVNSCPHSGVWLNIGAGEFFTPDRDYLRCGRHGAKFDIETGLCVDGPCKDKSLEPIQLAVIDGDVCISGVALEDDEASDPFVDLDDTMEIMIHPD